MRWKRYERTRRARLEWRIFAATLLGAALVLGACGGLGRADALVTDLVTRLDARPTSGQVAIVAIDDASVRELGRWPWPRARHAELLDRLHAAGARVVGMDVVFTEANDADPVGDRALAAALVRDAPVVLPLIAYRPPSAGRVEALLPAGALATAAARLGHINLDVDADGVARRVFLREGRTGPGGGAWEHMALAMWRLADPARAALPAAARRLPDAALLDIAASTPPQEQPVSGWLRDARLPVAYAGPPGTLPRYGYADVLAGRVPARAFAGRYVLVGATATGLGDAYATPMAGGELMPGVEIVANVLDGLIAGVARRDAAGWENALYNLWPVALALLLLRRGRPRVALAGIAVLMALDLAATLALHRWASVQVAPMASLLCLALAYPWWSWRRLEAAMRHITDEFTRMRRGNGFFRSARPGGGDRLERDLRDFEDAALQLDALQRLVRQSMDALPDAVLVLGPDGRVQLANAAAHRLFPVYPPLPTLAFAPVYDESAVATGEPPVARHPLSALLAERFGGGAALAAEDPALADFVAGRQALPVAGQMEIADDLGHTYLLKIVPRAMTVENILGWLATLTSVSLRQAAEDERDEALRFMAGPLRAVVAEQAQAAASVGTPAALALTDAYVQLARARSGVLQRHAEGAMPLLAEAMLRAARVSGLPPGRVPAAAERLDVDSYVLAPVLAQALALLAEFAGAARLPDASLNEAPAVAPAPGGTHPAVVEFRVACAATQAHRALAVLTAPLQIGAGPVSVATLNWLALRTIVARHGGRCSLWARAQELVAHLELPVAEKDAASGESTADGIPPTPDMPADAVHVPAPPPPG